MKLCVILCVPIVIYRDCVTKNRKMRKIALLLDLDGVLITTPTWKMDEIHTDGYSQFNVVCVENLNQILNFGRFEIYISSTRRKNKTIEEFIRFLKTEEFHKKLKLFYP